MMNRTLQLVLTVPLLVGLLSGCSPEIGSPEWCAQLKETPKGEWTTNQASGYAKHCLF